jgi:hypothetical protein
MSSSPAPKLTVHCPGCQAELVVDASTGAILHHRAAKSPAAGGRSFEDLFAELEAGKDRAEQRFEQEQAAMKDRERILEERFREAMRRAEEEPDEKPPKRPFDLD